MASLIVHVFVHSALDWILGADAPTHIVGDEGWGVVNPLILGKLQDPQAIVHTISGGRVFVSSKVLSLIFPDSVLEDDLDLPIQRILARLRHLTLNPRGPLDYSGTVIDHGVDLVALDIDSVAEPRGRTLELIPRRERLATTMDLVFQSVVRRAEERPLVYVDLILDAIKARYEDPKRSILYSAFATEIMAGSLIDQAHEEVQADMTTLGRWRFFEAALPGGGTVRKDPVFEHLRRASKRDFGILLHELPLYVWDRSLLEDDQALYGQAKDTQRLRSRLAHEGLIPGSEGVDQNEEIELAKRALGTAREVFAWFGCCDYFVGYGA